LVSFDPKDCPSGSGIYIMYGENNEPLYVGKAKNIRSRLFRHIRNHKEEKANFSLLSMDTDNKVLRVVIHSLETAPPIDLFLEKVERIKTIEVPSKDAKEKEKKLIKKLNPSFNKQYSDGYKDKDYAKLRNKIREVRVSSGLEKAQERKVREAWESGQP